MDTPRFDVERKDPANAIFEKDGIKYHVTRGAPPSMAALEQSLEEVKDLHEIKFGHSVDEEVAEHDGIKYHATRGAPPSMASLQKSLEEVKGLYASEFGHSVDEEVL